MADANVNPLRKSCKYSTAGRKNLKQTVRKQNERLQKEARGEVLRKKRNIEEVSPPSLNGKTGGNGMTGVYLQQTALKSLCAPGPH